MLINGVSSNGDSQSLEICLFLFAYFMASFDERVGFYFDWITLSSAFVAVDVSFSLSTKDARGHWAKRSKKVGAGGGGGGTGKERNRLPLSTDILPNAVRQRTGANDKLPLVNRLCIKLIDQNDIRFPFIKDQNMAESEENSWRVSFPSAETGAKDCYWEPCLRKGCAKSITDWFWQKCNFSVPSWCQREVD